MTWCCLRRRALIAVAAVAATAMAACGGDNRAAEAGPAGADVKGPVTLTFWHTMNEEETPTLKRLVEQFESAHPKFEIQLVTVPFDQAQQKYTTAAGAGKAPDVFRAEIAWTPEFAAQGFLADITDKISDRDDYLETAFGYNVLQDKVYGLPQVTDAPALLYNKQMLEAAGVEVPQTIDELGTACERLGAGKGIFLRADPYFTLPWIYGYGGDLVDVGGQRITVGERAAVEGVEAYRGLFESDCAFPNRDFANDYDNMQTAFKTGKVAMIVNGPWSSADIRAGDAFEDPENLGVAPFPKGPAGQGSPVGGHNYVISANTANVGAAYQFISELNSAENQAVLATENNLLPTRKSAYALPAVKDNGLLSAFGEQMQVATSRPVIPEGGQLLSPTGDFTDQLQGALTGKTSVGDALAAVADGWRSKILPAYELGS